MNVISYTQLFLAIVASMFAILVPVALSNVWYIYIYFFRLAFRLIQKSNLLKNSISFIAPKSNIWFQNHLYTFGCRFVEFIFGMEMIEPHICFVFFFAWQRIFILKIGRAIDLGMQPKVWFNGEVHSIIKFKIFILFSWIMRTHIHPSMPPSEILFRIRFVLYSLGYDTRWTLPNNENQNVLLFSFLFFVQVLFLASK